MICRILLLIILTSCVCAAAFVVNVPQSSYQAEEGQSITLEWTFTAKPDSFWSSLFIFCVLLTDHRDLFLYHIHEGDEVSESQEEQFAGRVQSDKDALREGRISLHVSRLRTEDSGLYLCFVKNDYGSGFGRCRLSVSAAADLSQPQRKTESPQPDTSGWIGLYVALIIIIGLRFGCALHGRRRALPVQRSFDI
ncbi:programmed cell death 1 ligand 1-like [Leuresthes tenuis]|uniref:programmed cell death 1 ligand 1-like n=1 Tax=Leuresthes tenuis TaxID=355514 RepID=UPI003B506092